MAVDRLYFKLTEDSDTPSYEIPLLDVAPVLEQMRSDGVSLSEVSRVANTYMRCPLGKEPSTVSVLVLREYLDQISLSQDHRLSFGVGKEAAIEFKGLIFKSMHKVMPSATGKKDGVYLVHLTDKRPLAALQSIVKSYNIPDFNAGPTEYICKTRKRANPWTWKQIAEDLWTACVHLGNWIDEGDDIDGAPATARQATDYAVTWPASTPENLIYDGVSAWDALCDFCSRAGVVVRHDPFEGTYDLIAPGVEDDREAEMVIHEGGGTDIEDGQPYGKTEREEGDGIIEDEEIVGGPLFLPASVKVRFPIYYETPGNDAWHRQHYTVQADDADVLAELDDSLHPSFTNATAGAVIVDDLMFARFETPFNVDTGIPTDNQTPDNADDLNDRAVEVAADYYRRMLNGTRGRIVYRGGEVATTGPYVSEVVYRDYGGGLKTEMLRYPVADCRMDRKDVYGEDHVFEGYLLTDLPFAEETRTIVSVAQAVMLIMDPCGDLVDGNVVLIRNRDTTLSASAGTYIQWRVVNGENRPVWVACDPDVSSSYDSTSCEISSC